MPTNVNDANVDHESNIIYDANLAETVTNVENEPNSTKTIRYKVKRGDTISSLANKFNVEKSHLLSFND